MNVSSAHPNPLQPTAPQDRTALAPVRPPKKIGDAADDAQTGGRQEIIVGRVTDPAERERLAADLQHQAAGNRHAQRALAAYADVANEHPRDDLRALLGFDARA